uniref:PB1-like domain-containing protein n=1 Tax=Tanacetum cinerariifolium TaxID=118510 RepID=A0A699GWY8_TANCI|nr:hypothetical protein [Tanacetum cinerariifolium]
MYVSGRVDIFDMVDIDLFTVVALNKMVLKLGYTSKSEPMFYNYLKPLTSLDEGLYALACEEDVRCLGTFIRIFKLIEVYIEHDVIVLDSYLRAPRFRATLEEITDEASSIATNRNEKMLLLTCHESSETTKEPVCESVTPSSLPQHDSSTPYKDSVCKSITPRCMPDCILSPPADESVITYTHIVSQQVTASQVIDDMMRQLSFDEIELDGEAGFTDVARGGVDSLGLSHDESFGVDDMELILNKPVNLNVSQAETQSKLPLSEEPDVGRTHMDLPFVNIGITNLVPDDVLEGEDMDVINSNGFDSDPGNDEEKNYKKRRLAKLGTEIEGTGPTGPNHRMEIGPSGSSGPTTRSKKKKNTGANDDSQASPSFLDAHDKEDLCLWVLEIKHYTYNFLFEKIFKQVRINPDIPVEAVQDQLQRELKVQISMSKAFKAKAKVKREIRGDHVFAVFYD